jgi:hypothetical protein
LPELGEAIDVSPMTMHRTRKAYVELGLSAAIEGKPERVNTFETLAGGI